MGILDLFKSSKSSNRTTTSYATWVDPPVTPPTAEWERRLNNYAKKCARQLTEAGVPTFRSEWPGKNCYQDAFWVIAIDVEVADRKWVAHPLPFPPDPDGYPPYKKGEFMSHFVGEALLLTKSGVLCVAQAEGGLKRSGGGVDNRLMEIGFSQIHRPIDKLRCSDWGWTNVAKWRPNRQGEYNRNGLQYYKVCTRFERKQGFKKSFADDGRDTSRALGNFVKSGGNIQWPRWFTSF